MHEETSAVLTDELEHYGVIGMKWGVRKDPQTAYNKSGEKLKKLDTKVTKGTTKAQKKLEKAWSKTNKAQRALLFKGVKKWRAAGQTNRALKSYAKVQSDTSKAMRWQKAREKAFKNTTVSNLNPEYEKLGKKYSEMTIDSLASNNVTMNALYDMYARNKTSFNR